VPDTCSELQDLQQPVREMHQRFHELIEPLRPDLYRYFLSLCGSPFDAEDLVQETLTRAFGRLFQFYQPLEARKYIFRMATNLWIDQQRRARKIRFEPFEVDPGSSAFNPETSVDTHAALERAVDLLEPRQRVALLLKDVLGFSLDEIATFLETTPGAVKALLHRGRVRVSSTPAETAPSTPDPAVTRLAQAYADRFTAQDWDGLVSLLRQDATATIVGVDEEHGRDYIRGTSIQDTSLNILPGQRAEATLLDGEPVILHLFRPDEGQEGLRSVIRISTDGHDITHVRDYWYCPDVVREVAARLNLRAAPSGSYTI
jgi:RNA polymerase sigma-70 factor, ECF subfamily